MSENRVVLPGSFSGIWIFKLYVCGETPRAMKAYYNLKKVCDERLDAKYKIEVVDLVKNPEVARDDNITACPTVVKESPAPKTRVVGDLSKTEMVLNKFDLPPSSSLPSIGKARSVSLLSAPFFM